MCALGPQGGWGIHGAQRKTINSSCFSCRFSSVVWIYSLLTECINISPQQPPSCSTASSFHMWPKRADLPVSPVSCLPLVLQSSSLHIYIYSYLLVCWNKLCKNGFIFLFFFKSTKVLDSCTFALAPTFEQIPSHPFASLRAACTLSHSSQTSTLSFFSSSTPLLPHLACSTFSLFYQLCHFYPDSSSSFPSLVFCNIAATAFSVLPSFCSQFRRLVSPFFPSWMSELSFTVTMIQNLFVSPV